MPNHFFSLLVSTGIVSLRKCSGLLIPLSSDAKPHHTGECVKTMAVSMALLWDHSPVEIREVSCETVSLWLSRLCPTSSDAACRRALNARRPAGVELALSSGAGTVVWSWHHHVELTTSCRADCISASVGLFTPPLIKLPSTEGCKGNVATLHMLSMLSAPHEGLPLSDLQEPRHAMRHTPPDQDRGYKTPPSCSTALPISSPNYDHVNCRIVSHLPHPLLLFLLASQCEAAGHNQSSALQVCLYEALERPRAQQGNNLACNFAIPAVFEGRPNHIWQLLGIVGRPHGEPEAVED